MFLGHFGVGLAAKRYAPRASLGVLLLAAQFIDLLWPTLLLLGVERVAIAPGATVVTPLDFQHYPVSHSLLAVAAWAVLVGGGYLALRGRRREALVLALLVLSHWFLDALVHRPDLPLTPFGEARVGLGLWNSMTATLLVEMPIFLAGGWLYARATRPRDAAGRWGLWGLMGFLLLIQAANLFGEPPPSVTAIAWVGQAQWLLVLWGFWLDRHREPRATDV
jgi:membrane-bound metal-dependent hydrolase YbcI (DUF457 family)